MSDQPNQLATGSPEIRKANEASAREISRSIQVAADSTHTFEVKRAENVNGPWLIGIWSLFVGNMRAMYIASSFGWDSIPKKEELFDNLSRFILVYPISAPTSLAAFTMFRFEFEDGKNILYCYEIQVSKSSQRHGLGRTLMNYLVNIGNDFGMDKIMLTVLKANEQALKFYDEMGFELDPGSPKEEGEEDYKILSKRLERLN